MKKISIFLFGTLFLLSCSKEDQPAPENQSPASPQLLAPQNNLFCTTNVQEFEWSQVIDPEADEVTYVLEISTAEDFEELFFTVESSGLSNTVPLDKGEDYYWRVLAEDAMGNKSPYSASRRLYTEGEPVSNYLPASPALVSPEDASKVTGTMVNLQWTAEDADGDELLFDLYLGKTEAPERVAENLEAAAYEVELEPGNTYYWQVVARDEHNGSTKGKLWTFRL